MAFALEFNSKSERVILNYTWDLWWNGYQYSSPHWTNKRDKHCFCEGVNTAVARCRDCDCLVCRKCVARHAAKTCFIVELSENFYSPMYDESLFYCEGCKSYASYYCKLSTHISTQVRMLKNEVTNSREQARKDLNDAQKFISNLVAHIKQSHKDSPLAYQICDTKFNDLIFNVHLFIHKYITYNCLLNNCETSADMFNTKCRIEEFVQEVVPFIKQFNLPHNHTKPISMALPFPPLCLIQDHQTTKAFINQFSTFTIHARDVSNKPTALDQDFISIKCDKIHNFHLIPQNDHKFLVKYIPTIAGTITISVKILNIHVGNSPLTIRVDVRDLTKISTPVAVFGSKGEGDGEFSRPWGVCCDAQSRIIVADRSNHRVQVFNINGQFLFKFGTHGAEEGQFNLPVGVTVDDEQCRIIVVDKDNHRVQLFTMTGEFVRTFGELGNGNGQLNYPWDVAVNSAHQILVADSRNHRVQLFDFAGQFVSVCPAHIFNSPRGLCFTQDDEILVSDFDFHYLNVLSDMVKCSKIIGSLGEAVGQFNRPSGIDVDGEGNIVVVDSKNHRIQIFDRSGTFVHAFGVNGCGVGEFNRPSDVCVSPEGKIIVVDFENSRVQIY